MKNRRVFKTNSTTRFLFVLKREVQEILDIYKTYEKSYLWIPVKNPDQRIAHRKAGEYVFEAFGDTYWFKYEYHESHGHCFFNKRIEKNGRKTTKKVLNTVLKKAMKIIKDRNDKKNKILQAKQKREEITIWKNFRKQIINHSQDGPGEWNLKYVIEEIKDMKTFTDLWDHAHVAELTALMLKYVENLIIPKHHEYTFHWYAVGDNPMVIKDISNPQEMIVRKALSIEGHAIKHVNCPTLEMQIDAVKQNGFALVDIDNPIKKVKIEALKQNAYVIENIEQPDNILQVIAIAQNKHAFGLIQTPTRDARALYETLIGKENNKKYCLIHKLNKLHEQVKDCNLNNDWHNQIETVKEQLSTGQIDKQKANQAYQELFKIIKNV